MESLNLFGTEYNSTRAAKVTVTKIHLTTGEVITANSKDIDWKTGRLEVHDATINHPNGGGIDVKYIEINSAHIVYQYVD